MRGSPESPDAEKPSLEADRKPSHVVVTAEGTIVNASGHRDQLKRQYGLLGICGLALTIDNAWIAFAGSLVVAYANGGPPGVLYEFLTACAYYTFIGLCIAELASAIPSAGGVYHWASVTAGKKHGRALGFFTGWINFFGWIFDLASIVTIPANVVMQMYLLYHPTFVIKAWHIYVVFVIITWTCCVFVIFCNNLIPYLQHLGIFLVVVGGIVTIAVVAAVPRTHASSSFVWSDWQNVTGWPSGVAFLTGVLNGAFTIGTPDAVTHMAEELPDPKRDLPKAVAAQIGLGTLTTFCYAVAIFYAINDPAAVLGSSGTFPVAVVYHQATGSAGGTFGLLFIVLLSILICVVGTFLTVGRILWSLARDRATPFAALLGRVDERLSCPVPATVFCAVLCTAFGAVALGSTTAFLDLVGSFIILTTTSYALAIGPHLLTGRRNVPPGPFWMGRAPGFVVNALTVVLIVFFNVMFCFPYGRPVTVQGMNYNAVILAGIVFIAACWWFAHARRNYPGPKLSGLYIDGVVVEGDRPFADDVSKHQPPEKRE